VLYGPTEHLLDGEATLVEEIGGVRLRISSTAFFQVNRGTAERLYADLGRALDPRPEDRIIDAFSGVGGIALSLALRSPAREIIGIEERAEAVEDARRACALNPLAPAAAPAGPDARVVRFIAGDVADRLRELDRADLIVLNPPRRGCAPEVLDACARLSPRLIAYVSCAPASLGRDLDRLRQLGLTTRSVQPYDMLLGTPHVEALAILTRR
jgi:23S rRNA (uracil1939-C5)-methyltransferase